MAADAAFCKASEAKASPLWIVVVLSSLFAALIALVVAGFFVHLPELHRVLWYFMVATLWMAWVALIFLNWQKEKKAQATGSNPNY